MMHVLYEICGWPNGIIVGNLMASVIWASAFEWRLRIHHRKIHEHIDRAANGPSNGNSQ